MLLFSAAGSADAATLGIVALQLAIAITLLRAACLLVYNLFFHPLRAYPGPLLWRATRLPYDVHVWRGTMHGRVKALHLAYGTAVRVTPSDVSFASAAAMHDILARIPDQAEFPKESGRRTHAPNGAASILGADYETHARFRKLLAPAFSERGMQKQEPLIMQYVDLLVARLAEYARSGESADMVVWFNRTTFDVIGDLAFGEPFDGLKTRTTHPWIPHLFQGVKYFAQIAAIRPWMPDGLANRLASLKTVLEGRKMSFAYAQDRVARRLEYGRDRGDFWDGVISKGQGIDNVSGQGMTQPEMVNNASALVLAGSETTASVLSATTYFILKHPHVLHRVTTEVRSTYKRASDISLLSVSRLEYMLAVFNEAQRIYPAVPQVFPRTPPPGGAVVAGKLIPEGMGTIVHLLAAFHHPVNFHRADEFLPERWLLEPGDKQAVNSEFADDRRDVFQPFSIGPRSCLGRNLATAEMRLILAKLLFHFDLALDSEAAVAGATGDWLDQKAWALWDKKPLCVKIASYQ